MRGRFKYTFYDIVLNASNTRHNHTQCFENDFLMFFLLLCMCSKQSVLEVIPQNWLLGNHPKTHGIIDPRIKI